VWEVIQRFGCISLNELNGNDINRLENVMTLEKTQHSIFGVLCSWLEAVDVSSVYSTLRSAFSDFSFSKQHEPNTYRIRATDRLHHSALPIGQLVTFRTTDVKLKLPDPRYIALHAACAQVIDASGMGRHLDQILTDQEELNVLPENGHSDVLMNALRAVTIC
jgi:hypothetical protein